MGSHYILLGMICNW